jgi:hypothetical protein
VISTYLWYCADDLDCKLSILAVTGSDDFSECALTKQIDQVVTTANAASFLYNVVPVLVIDLVGALVTLRRISDRSTVEGAFDLRREVLALPHHVASCAV